ncbi:putative adenine phosphoribosyltransferase [Enterococcus faecium PC4.1]|nr:putative adenine phosphoribosyltransferase [Enterococcus faecium PC4.1]
MDLKDYIASIPDYPSKGIVFRDISPLMADGDAYREATKQIVNYAKEKRIDMVVGPEARGFIVGCPVAYELGVGFAPVRKKRKITSRNHRSDLWIRIWNRYIDIA